ncbi:hypothetical protein [Aquibium oceanicum]|uniref:Uncharacterized protein n=1 Tax=Aquibium oceanicum TaxID=1670800 RepID=A0A1L3SWN2_9HYPH|nr:hypothetical protein [Aquibium oceanicum]APH73808.1 hypothetical protein BSQ44_22310 [Aquibium oceanicum]
MVGLRSSASEVAREALRLLRHERAQEAEKLAILRREIGVGVEAVNSGRVSKKSVRDLLEEVMLDSSKG